MPQHSNTRILLQPAYDNLLHHFRRYLLSITIDSTLSHDNDIEPPAGETLLQSLQRITLRNLNGGNMEHVWKCMYVWKMYVMIRVEPVQVCCRASRASHVEEGSQE